MNEIPRLSVEEQKTFKEFEERYTTFTKILEQRINLGKAFEQVNFEEIMTREKIFSLAKTRLTCCNIESRLENIRCGVYSVQEDTVEVHKFGRDLESSLTSLEGLIDQETEIRSEKGNAHMDNLFEMITDTLSHEKQQGSAFSSLVY